MRADCFFISLYEKNTLYDVHSSIRATILHCTHDNIIESALRNGYADDILCIICVLYVDCTYILCTVVYRAKRNWYTIVDVVVGLKSNECERYSAVNILLGSTTQYIRYFCCCCYCCCSSLRADH